MNRILSGFVIMASVTGCGADRAPSSSAGAGGALAGTAGGMTSASGSASTAAGGAPGALTGAGGLAVGGASGVGGANGAAGSGGSPAGPGGALAGGGGATDSGVSSPGAGGTAGDATDGRGGAPSCPSSTVTPAQLVFIGDSFIAAPTSNIAPELETLFQQNGVKAYGASPRYYQLVGTTMSQIAAQYDRAHSENPDIKVVIGDGGGNDVLITDRSCLTQAPPANQTCATTITNALDVADKTMTKMEADGVEHLVFFFYPHERTQGLYQGAAPAINDTLDYTEPLAKKICDQHSICLFVSLRLASGDAVGSGYVERGYINSNDVHPSSDGSKFFAGAIWSAMQAKCILTP